MLWQEAVKVAPGVGAGDRMSALAAHVLGQRWHAPRLGSTTHVPLVHLFHSAPTQLRPLGCCALSVCLLLAAHALNQRKAL